MRHESDEFAGKLIERIPKLRSYARSLAKDSTVADDLVQDTLLRAWHKQETFTQGTNLGAWLNTILRNSFLSSTRRARYVDNSRSDDVLDLVKSLPNQEAALACQQLNDEIGRLPMHQRQALILVTLDGESYEQAAQSCGCSIGTIKSRISRARRQLKDAFPN